MKKLLFLAIVCAVGYYQSPVIKTWASETIGYGKGAYGITDEDPLGKVDNFKSSMARFGLELDEDSQQRPGTYKFVSEKDMDKYPDFPAYIVVKADEDDFIYKITAVFKSTQRGFAPMQRTAVESYMGEYWMELLEEKPKFAKGFGGNINFPGGVIFPMDHQAAKYDDPDLKARWIFSLADDRPMEAVEIALK